MFCNAPVHGINVDEIGGVDSSVFFYSLADDGIGAYNIYVFMLV